MSLGAFLRGAAPLGHLVWWTSTGLVVSAADLRPRWGRALPPVTEGLPEALEQVMRALPAIPLVDRSGVFWVAPDFDAQLDALDEVLLQFRGWELHTVAVRATRDTLEALRSSATRSLEQGLSTLAVELETLLNSPRERPALLVRRLDAVEALRRQAELHARHLELRHEGLSARLDAWAQRIDAALCARIVA
mgnify:CR=1 FL=1